MKPQFERAAESACTAIKYLIQHFPESEIEKDPRLKTLLGLMRAIPQTVPSYSTAALVVEFDKETGRPIVNKELADRYIEQQIEKAVALAEPNVEIDLIDSSRDDFLIERLNFVTAWVGDEPAPLVSSNEARFLLKMRLEMYHEAISKINVALGGRRNEN